MEPPAIAQQLEPAKSNMGIQHIIARATPPKLREDENDENIKVIASNAAFCDQSPSKEPESQERVTMQPARTSDADCRLTIGEYSSQLLGVDGGQQTSFQQAIQHT